MAGELPEDIKATLSILDSQTPPPPATLKTTRTMEDIALPTKRQPAGGDDVSQTLAILDGKEPEPVATAGEPDPRDIEVDVLKLALRKGINSNTALAAHRQSVARKLNISPALVTPQAEESAFYQDHDPEDLHKNYPALAKYLKVEGNAELVGKNIEPMKELEVFFRRAVQDPEIVAAKGVVGAVQTLVGLGNLVSAGKAGKYVEEHGIDLKKIQSVLNDLYSPEAQAALKSVEEAEGFSGTLTAALKNPSSIGLFVGESLPQMYLGRIFGSGLKAAFPGLSFGAAGAAGEGITMAGGSVEQIRSATEDGELTVGQAALSVGVGVAGTALSAFGAKLATKLGIEDVDAALVAGKLLSRLEDSGVPKQLAVRLVGGAAIEGAVEEMPQSVVEQIAQNVALGRSWDEGVPESAALGLVTGGAMGAAVQVGAVRGKQPTVTETPAEKQARTTVQNSILKTAAAVNAEEQRNAIKEWGQRVASNNPLRKEAPDSFKEFVRTMAEEDGALKEVYVDGNLLRESLAQAGIDEDKLKTTMPEVAESLGEALATNGEARIPIEDYAAHIVGTPVEQAILDHLRTTPEGMTYAEAQVYFQEQQDDFIKQAEALVSLNEPVLSRKEFEAQAPEGVKYKDYLAAHKNKVEVFAKDLETVHDKLLEGLDSMGRFHKSITRVYAIPFREFYATNAVRMGVLPTELYDSLPLNFQRMSAGDVLNPEGLSQSEIERRLVAQHNISVEKLIHADRVGGLAAPSLAITDKAHTFDSFGEITLIADKSMVDPKKGAKAFAADIYSTRYPSVHYSFSEEKVNRLNKQLAPYRELTNSPEIGVRELNGESTEAKRALRGNAAVMAAFLESKKIKPKLVKVKKTKLPRWAAKYAAESMYRYADDPQFIKDVEKNLDDNSRERLKEYSAEERQRRLRNLAHAKAQEIERYRVELPEQGKVSPSDTMKVMTEQMYAKGLQKDYGPYVQKLLHELNPEEKIFKGFSYSGARKYVPHTIEAAIAEIKKNLRGGEGANFGPAVIRAAHTQQFRSVEQIKTAREALVSDADFERIKDEVEKEFFEVADELSKYYKHKHDIFYAHETAAMIDAPTLGLQRALKENQFENVPKEVEDRVRDFLAKLYNLPTEYFEVKLLRAVHFGEFKGAVVPEGVAKEALEILKKNGVTDIKFYKPQNKADRLAKVNEFDDMFFQSANIPETLNIDGVERPTRNSEGKLIHPTEEGIRNFWKWFGDSKVVDAQGRPKVLYHGTPDMSFDIFNPETYFSESGEIASIYTDAAASSISSKAKQANAPGVYPVYVKMINPFDTRKTKQRDEFNNEYYLKYGTGTPLMDSGLPDWNDARDLSEWISESGKNYDGLLLDEGGLPQTDGSVKSRGISYAPLKGGNAIQSAIGNTGAFSDDQNILKQSAFYSALQREIPSISKIADKNGMVKTDQAVAWIEARQKEGKFKLEEVEAVGLKDWLQATEGKVSVADIDAFVRENGVQIEETLLGEPSNELNSEPAFYEYDEDNEQYAVYSYQIDSTEYYDSESEAADRVEELNADVPSGETKFESYVLPGGKNYRELLLRLPANKQEAGQEIKRLENGRWGLFSKGERIQSFKTEEEALAAIIPGAVVADVRFRSAHFDQPNILAHVRVDERTVGDQRVLFVEEIQSDWAQQGRDKGFARPRWTPVEERRVRELEKPRPYPGLTQSEREEYASLMRKQIEYGPPTGPFVQNTKSWVALAVKRLLRYAAENGFDKIAWTTGGQQAVRYSEALLAVVDEIRYKKNEDGTFTFVPYKDGNGVHKFEESNVPISRVSEVLGKDIASKMEEGAGRDDGGIKVLEGLDLKIGGEGMKAFYDQIVPQVVNEVSKKLGGGRVYFSEIPFGESDPSAENFVYWAKRRSGNELTRNELYSKWAKGYDDPLVAEYMKAEVISEQHSLDITPEMRDKIMQGLPLFQGQRAGFDPSTFTISLLKGADLSSVIHEGAHFYLEALADLAGRDNAPQQIKDDFRTTLNWFGITGNETGVPGGDLLEQRAFHGSPHDHNKFDSSKIGTGEGAQAYGYGHYFSDTRSIGEFYKNTLTIDRGFTFGEREGLTRSEVRDLVAKRFGYDYLDNVIRPAGVADRVMDALIYGGDNPYKKGSQRHELFGDLISRIGRPKSSGKLYEVELAPEQDEYLLWDKPLSEQSEKVKSALKELGINSDKSPDEMSDLELKGALGGFENTLGKGEATGAKLYKELASHFNGDKRASEYLHLLGIRGIKYLDGSSRAKGEGAYNYVVFDDEDIEIINKYAQSAKLPETINVDGVERPTMNSEGKPIYPTEEGIRNFWKWFGDSKVVDDQGRPKVMYHGTHGDFDTFEVNEALGGAIFLAPDAGYAGNFAYAKGANTRPVYVRVVNPRRGVISARDEARLLPKARSRGQDGAYVHDSSGEENNLAVFNPDQIKSAIGNNGDFSASPNILEQGGETPPPGQLPSGKTPEEIWRSMTLDQKRRYHEQWAQSYELYTIEGKAPTVEMQPVFSRFSEWVLSVYKTMKAFFAQNPLAGKLNDDIRAVFDRLIASEDKIHQAEEARGYSALFGSAAEAGSSEKKFEDYQNLGKLASMRAVDEMKGRSIRDMRWLSNAKDKTIRKMQAEAKTKRAAVMAQVTDEVDDMPLNRARNFLTKGEFIDEQGVRRESETKFKLNSAEVKALSNGRIPDAVKGMVSDDGVGLELAAKLLGYQNPEALLNDLVNGESRDVTIQGLTDQRMLEQYGDLIDDKAIERAAEKAIHNEARARFMATGLKLLSKTELSVTQLNRAAKMAAEATIAKKKIRALTPGQFTRAEAKANREALENVAHDPKKAIDAQRAALLNNRLAKAALEAAEDVDSILKYFKKFESKGVRKAVGIDQIDQIDDLLQSVDRDKSLPLREIDKRQALAEWVAEQEADGFEPVLDPILAEQIKAKHYKEMTVDELRMLRDTVKQIEHVGRLKQTLLTEMRRADFRERVEEAEASIRDNANRTVKERGTPTDVAGLTGQWVRQMIASHRKFSSYMREMDGGKDGGVMWRLLSKNMNAAGDKEIEMRRASGEAIAELFKGFKQEKAPLNLYAKRTQIPGTEIFMTQEQRIMFGMNWGNEGNRQRALDGGITGKRALSITEAQAILDTLTKEEWDFIQGTLDHIATYKDQIAALERKLTGIEPEWIEPAEIKTKYGTYRGGYFPAKYDVELSSRSESLEAAVDLRMGMKGAFNTAATRNGYTKQRSEAVMNRPLLLSYNVIANHVSEVTHRLAWQPWLIDANRILKALDAPIREHYGAEVLRELRNTVIDIAAGDIGARTPMERAINHLRTGSTIVGMGWRFSTAFLQPSGLAQSWARIGGRWMAKGIAESLKNPNKAGEFVNARSSLMKNRDITMNREVREVLDRIRTTEGVNAVTGSYFSLIAKMQRMVDIPTWMGAYEKALHDLKYEDTADAEQRAQIENDAVALADQAVVDSQSGGQIKDLASIQRGHPGLKLFTNFYSYFSATYNLNIEALRRTNFRSPTDVAFLASDLVLLNVLPVIFAVALKEMTKGKCGDDLECLAASYGYEQMGFMFGQMVLLRDAGSAALVAAGGDQFGYSGPAGLRFFSDLYKAGVQTNQGELDWPLFKSVSNTVGVLLHFPTGQINTTLEGIIAVENGDVDGVSILPALLFGPPKE